MKKLIQLTSLKDEAVDSPEFWLVVDKIISIYSDNGRTVIESYTGYHTVKESMDDVIRLMTGGLN